MGSSGKRYGIVLWVMLLGMAEMLAGCAGASSDSGGIGGRAYADEGEGADDAVNTLQVGGKYRIVTPMMELKEAVVDIRRQLLAGRFVFRGRAGGAHRYFQQHV